MQKKMAVQRALLWLSGRVRQKNWQYNYYFDYTIPEDYDEDTIKIDLIGDLEKCYEEGIYEPGDGNNFYVNIVNLSGTNMFTAMVP